MPKEIKRLLLLLTRKKPTEEKKVKPTESSTVVNKKKRARIKLFCCFVEDLEEQQQRAGFWSLEWIFSHCLWQTLYVVVKNRGKRCLSTTRRTWSWRLCYKVSQIDLSQTQLWNKIIGCFGKLLWGFFIHGYKKGEIPRKFFSVSFPGKKNSKLFKYEFVSLSLRIYRVPKRLAKVFSAAKKRE